VYWILYPAWPVGRGYTQGINTVTYESEGKKVTTHWNTRAELIEEMQSGDQALKQKAYLDKVAQASYQEIENDPDMVAFTNSMAKVIFADNCAACHGVGGVPAKLGQYPNLADDSWLWGGDIEDIEATIQHGRLGFMPAFKETLNAEQLDQVANYVLSLSGHEVDADLAAKGETIFQGQTGGCHYCHTSKGTGLASQGAANLTDAIWTVADVPGSTNLKDKLAQVKQVIRNGIKRQMPAWSDRLSQEQIKLLTVYVHSLGGGQ
jgi:cytochrome c oxidase cbb3-type subunit 3